LIPIAAPSDHGPRGLLALTYFVTPPTKRKREVVAGAHAIREDLERVEGRPYVPMTGEEIVNELRALADTDRRKNGTTIPGWLSHAALVRAIDAGVPVNLGGAGGPMRGKTPEAVAAMIVDKLVSSRKSSTRRKKRRAVTRR
jgi:hypothetical protein